MIMNNPHESVNHIPFLSQEMERTLRRFAWKDEDFREALIANPKGIIQQVFPHYFPDGKVPDDLTINIVEQDPSTRHIVLPAFAEEEPILEIAEEELLDLIVNLGAFDRKRSRESYDAHQPNKSADESRKPSFSEADAKRRDQVKEQDANTPTEKPFTKSLLEALKKDPEVYKAVDQALHTNGILENETIQMMQKKGYLPESVKSIQLSQNTEKKWTIVVSSLPDAYQKSGVSSNKELLHIVNRDIHRDLIQTNTCSGCSAYTCPCSHTNSRSERQISNEVQQGEMPRWNLYHGTQIGINIVGSEANCYSASQREKKKGASEFERLLTYARFSFLVCCSDRKRHHRTSTLLSALVSDMT